MAEATAVNMLSELKAITECSICIETFQDPRILPCIHTFCLKCMQQMAKQGNKKPGDMLSCPICRKEITLSDDETMGLQKNFFMARLIEMVMILKPVDKAPLCNICVMAEPEDSSARIEAATMYCLDCRDALCPECSVHHKKQRFSRDHRVITLGSVENEEELLEKSPLGFCDEHKKEQQKSYCMDCKMLACVLCFVESHRLHDCRNVSKVADELRPQIIADVSRVSSHIAEMVTQKEQLGTEATAFLATIAELENEILRRSSELKELVDKSTESVLEELSEKKKQRLKEIANKKEDNESHLTILKTFQTYCNGIISKGTDGDVCRVANDLSRRTDELQKLHQTHISQDLPSMKITFEIMKLSSSAQRNIIGTIKVGTCVYQCINEKESAPQKTNPKVDRLMYDSIENFGLHQKAESIESKEEFHFFGGYKSSLHPHHRAEFQVDGVKYNFVEQYVLHKKAEMFKSTKDVAELMKITDPNHLKQFDKLLTVADAKLWETKREEFMKKGYLEKSKQVKTLFDLLQYTKGKHLVYATGKDSVLGIGVDANDPLSRRKSSWKGKNLLGEWLMEVRAALPNELECSFEDIVSKQEAIGTAKEKDSSGPEKFFFFWRTESPFSQWYPCSFIIDGQWYNSAEQYMMHQKAVTFGDHEIALRILRSRVPQEQKKLGRNVDKFDDEIWSAICMDIAKRGNLAKFGQNEKLKGILFETAGTTLVEASPVDSIWGIGLDAKDPRAMDRKQWPGKNQLGQVLTEVREELMRRERGKV